MHKQLGKNYKESSGMQRNSLIMVILIYLILQIKKGFIGDLTYLTTKKTLDESLGGTSPRLRVLYAEELAIYRSAIRRLTMSPGRYQRDLGGIFMGLIFTY